MNNEIISACRVAASKYGVPLSTLLGVVEQESNGVVFGVIDDVMEPIVRWEGHYFHKRLQGNARTEAIARGLASPYAGGIKNPASQKARWHRLIRPAMEIDRNAAIESVSWGVGQVMGAHWKALGFASAEELYDRARSGVEGQVDIMMRYCATAGLLDELRRSDFVGFTRGYNGPGNVASYSASMRKKAEAMAKMLAEKNEPDLSETETVLRMGMTGERVRSLQSSLKRLIGEPAEIDGDFGPATKRAVMHLQERAGLPQDGIAGPLTLHVIAKGIS